MYFLLFSIFFNIIFFYVIHLSVHMIFILRNNSKLIQLHNLINKRDYIFGDKFSEANFSTSNIFWSKNFKKSIKTLKKLKIYIIFSPLLKLNEYIINIIKKWQKTLHNNFRNDGREIVYIILIQQIYNFSLISYNKYPSKIKVKIIYPLIFYSFQFNININLKHDYIILTFIL